MFQNTPMAKPVQESLTILQTAQKEINDKLQDPLFVHRRLEINKHFKLIETQLKYMGAVIEPSFKTSANGKTERTAFKPITNFMGEKIEIAKPVKVADLKPSDPEKEKYIEKVNKLYAQFTTLAPEGILNGYTIPEDILVLRGVAKRAGVENYEDAPLNLKFIEDIALAIEIKADEEKEQKNIDKELKKQNKTVTEGKAITQADIDADPELQKINAKPGDLISTDAAGKKTKLIKK